MKNLKLNSIMKKIVWTLFVLPLMIGCTQTTDESKKTGGAAELGFTGNPFETLPEVPGVSGGQGLIDSQFSSIGADSAGSSSASTFKYKALNQQLSSAQLNEWMSAFDATVAQQDKPFTKYVYIDQEFASDPTLANKARVALFKALNHVAIENSDVKIGKDASDGHGLLWALDTREFFGASAQQKWDLVARPRLVQGMISAPQYNRHQPFRVENFEAASRVVYNLVAPDAYVQLIETPSNEYVLHRELGIPARECTAFMGQIDAIVYGSRVACMRYTADGRIYWNTADDFDGREGDPLPYLSGRVNSLAPQFRFYDGMLNFPGAGTIASEAWVGMKNGFIAYYIWGNANQRRGRAETFVDDPDNVGGFGGQFNANITQFQGHYLETGRSCISCHAQGPQSKPSDMAIALKNGSLSGATLQQAQQFWTPEEELNGYYEESRLLFQKAMKSVVMGVSDGSASENDQLINGAGGEPILMMVKVIDRTAR